VTLTDEGFKRPPRLLLRALLATFAAIVAVLSIVFVTFTVESRHRLMRETAENLDTGQRVFAALERRHQAEVFLQAAVLAESPTLKAALDTYQVETHQATVAPSTELLATVAREAERLATHATADAVVVVDAAGRVLASGGPKHRAWAPRQTLPLEGDPAIADERVLMLSGSVFRVITVPLALEGTPIGRLLLAMSIDDGFARELSAVSRADTAVVLGGQVIASTLDPQRRAALRAIAARLPEEGVVELGDDAHAIRRLLRIGDAELYALDSITRASAAANAEASRVIALIGIGALILGGLASLWLARSLARPINQLSRQLERMARLREFSHRLPRAGASQELDALTDTFNALTASLLAAENDTRTAYLATIKALAAALDARDPYTAGHSERVSALAVMIGRQMRLDDEQLDVLRLGALLHDIGKIGIRDRVLSKNGPLTDEEFEIIKTHPSVGANILRHVPMLEAHVPIVELHHEQPNGRGYPYGLLGNATPLPARIVHVADAFDAMTSARAYRPAQHVEHAIDELVRHRGTQFDAAVVDAFLTAWEAQGRAALTEIAPIVASVNASPSVGLVRTAGGAA
jgi:putative nucleotidyltransferase with HDIG domain